MTLTPEQSANLEERSHILSVCERDRSKQLDFNTRCSEDIHFWLKYFGYTYDPRKTPSVIPFIEYPYQEIVIDEIVDHVRNGRDLLVEKSRDMGLTWLVIYVFQWFWLYHRGSDFHCGSKKLENVDERGVKATILGKFRINLELLPSWMKPTGYNPTKHDAIARIINPENANTITGESANPDFSRSGRYKAILYDEFAFWPDAFSSWNGGADSAPCRIAISTPNTPFDKFYQLRSDVKNKTIDVKSILDEKRLPQLNEKEVLI